MGSRPDRSEIIAQAARWISENAHWRSRVDDGRESSVAHGQLDAAYQTIDS